MLGQLPTSLDVGGVDYAIRTDYRNILRIFSAFNDPELSDSEKVYVCMKRLYVDFEKIPNGLYEQAYTAATQFIECGMHEDTPGPRTVNWDKDEQLIFPAVNKVAGTEVRSLSYLHWWTFLGYYQSIDHDGLFGFILTIRQKKARGKKLEKYEQEFYRSNVNLCRIEDKPVPQKAEDTMKAMFDSLPEEGET
jgi:hypothetical protein